MATPSRCAAPSRTIEPMRRLRPVSRFGQHAAARSTTTRVRVRPGPGSAATPSTSSATSGLSPSTSEAGVDQGVRTVCGRAGNGESGASAGASSSWSYHHQRFLPKAAVPISHISCSASGTTERFRTTAGSGGAPTSTSRARAGCRMCTMSPWTILGSGRGGRLPTSATRGLPTSSAWRTPTAARRPRGSPFVEFGLALLRLLQDPRARAPAAPPGGLA